MKRKEPTLTDKLAAAIRELLQIPYEHAVMMTAEQMLSLVEWHHILYHRDSANDVHWNLEPMPIRAHRDRTAKIDIPQIAKTKRITKKEQEFRNRLLTPRDQRPPKRSRWGTRPLQTRRKKP